MIADDYDGDLLLFVTGIPSKASQEKLSNCLAEYGIFRIVSLRTGKSGSKIVEANPQSNLRRGFCIVQAFDLTSFSNLIAAKRIDFEGRCLGATKFRQGSELNQYANLEDSRRVILKKVLNYISQEDLYAAIENCLGQIKRIYRFEPEDHDIAAKKSVLKKSRTFSVEFSSAEIARKAVELRFLNLDCVPAPILIEAFKRPTQLAKSKAIAIELGPFRKPEAQIQISDNCYRFHNISTRITPFNLLPCQEAREYGKNYEIPEHGRPAWSWISPTKKCYFKLRADVLPLTYSNTADEDLRNLRFNMAEQ